jgi:hypothetical protein
MRLWRFWQRWKAGSTLKKEALYQYWSFSIMLGSIMFSKVPAYQDEFEGGHQHICCVNKGLCPPTTHRFALRGMIAGNFVQLEIRLPCNTVTVAVLVSIRVRRQVFVQVQLNPGGGNLNVCEIMFGSKQLVAL